MKTPMETPSKLCLEHDGKLVTEFAYKERLVLFVLKYVSTLYNGIYKLVCHI